MAKCDYCGKKARTGRRGKHRRGVASRKFRNRAQKRSRKFKPNIQKVTINVGGLKLRMKLCAKCLKALKKKNRGDSTKNKPKETG